MLRIFTDTAANIPPHLLEQYHITAMPLTYLLDGQPTELVGHDYYEAMRKGAEVKTSLVSPALIRDTMESALKDGDDVLYIAISGGISGTCWSAELMAEELRGEYPDRMIRVLNTCGASLGEGLVVLEAAKMLEKGCTADEIIRQAEENCGRMRQFFMVDDLKYLRRGRPHQRCGAGSGLSAEDQAHPSVRSGGPHHPAQQGSWSAEGHGDAGGVVQGVRCGRHPDGRYRPCRLSGRSAAAAG